MKPIWTVPQDDVGTSYLSDEETGRVRGCVKPEGGIFLAFGGLLRDGLVNYHGHTYRFLDSYATLESARAVVERSAGFGQPEINLGLELVKAEAAKEAAEKRVVRMVERAKAALRGYYRLARQMQAIGDAATLISAAVKGADVTYRYDEAMEKEALAGIDADAQE